MSLVIAKAQPLRGEWACRCKRKSWEMWSRHLSFGADLASLKLFTQTFEPAGSLAIDALNPDDICPTRSGTGRRLQLTTCDAAFISWPLPCAANIERA